jgi:outer membrane phospholipase A
MRICMTVMLLLLMLPNFSVAQTPKENVVDNAMLFQCISTCPGECKSSRRECTDKLTKCVDQCLTTADDKANMDESLDIVKRYRGNLHSYRPSYLGVTVFNSDNSDKWQLKFQFSFKYQLVPKVLEDLYFGYTQKSLWSIQKLSAPFKENNFAPELIYIYDRIPTDSSLKAVIFGIARHESTGEAGDGSRGWNLSYVEPFFSLGDSFILSLKLWAPMFFLPKDKMFESSNGNIFDYYGYGELGLKYRYDDKIQWRNSFRHGTDARRYGIESQIDIDLSAIPIIKNKYFNPTLFIQVWNGYGETLKTYNKSTTDVVIGLSAIR